MTRIVAPSRLHFGLLNVPVEGQERWPGLDGAPGLPIRQFGGVGVMVDEPGVAVRVERANEWLATGPLATRAIEFAKRFVGTLPENLRSPFCVDVERAGTEHSGLGVGTQLGLAVAKGIAMEIGHAGWSAEQLAVRVGRGERSAIGVHGFDRGGLIVEGGKIPGEMVSPLIAHHPLPAEWAVLLFSPEPAGSWHGGKESEAFARLGATAPSPGESATLCRITLTGILSGIASANLEQFGEAVYEFNARVGDLFVLAQGGRYASRAVESCIRRLRAAGIRCVGQSSWGPTVFAIVRSDDALAISEGFRDLSTLRTRGSMGAVA